MAAPCRRERIRARLRCRSRKTLPSATGELPSMLSRGTVNRDTDRGEGNVVVVVAAAAAAAAAAGAGASPLALAAVVLPASALPFTGSWRLPPPPLEASKATVSASYGTAGTGSALFMTNVGVLVPFFFALPDTPPLTGRMAPAAPIFVGRLGPPELGFWGRVGVSCGSVEGRGEEEGWVAAPVLVVPVAVSTVEWDWCACDPPAADETPFEEETDFSVDVTALVSACCAAEHTSTT